MVGLRRRLMLPAGQCMVLAVRTGNRRSDWRRCSSMNDFPIPIPDAVKDRMRSFFKPEPADILSRPAEMFGGKSAIHWVAAGHGTWEDVIAKYEAMLSYQIGP